MPKHASNKKPDAFEMFCFANCYYEAAAVLTVCRVQKDLAIHVSIGDRVENVEFNRNATIISSSVLLILSLEVFLKCLIRIRGRKPPRIHDVSELFAMLSAKDRRSLRRLFLTFPGYYEGKKRMGIKSAVRAASSFFNDIRYGYEISKGMRMPLLSVTAASTGRGTAGLCDVALATRSLILTKHPDWQQKYSARHEFH